MKPVSGTAGPAFDATRLTSVPRDVRLSSSGKAAAALAIVFAMGAVAVAIGLSVVHAQQHLAAELRAREAVHAPATVVRVARIRGDQPRTVVTYRYIVAGTERERTVRLRGRRSFAERDRIGIVYLRSQPDQTWVEGDEPGAVPVWLIPLVPAVLLLLAWLIASTVRRQKSLLAEGRFADARIVSTKKSRGEHRSYRIDYEFRTLSGARVTSRTDTRRVPAAVGAIVPVIYHRDNPRWNALYPLSLVTPAKN